MAGNYRVIKQLTKHCGLYGKQYIWLIIHYDYCKQH